MINAIRIDRFLDMDGRITQLPQKHSTRYAVLAYLATKFCLNVDYAERQVNDICNQWHTFGDCFMLRRELIDNGLLGRVRDGSRYWRTGIEQPAESSAADNDQTLENK